MMVFYLFAGNDGKILTSRKIGERLFKETQRDVSLKVEQIDSENFSVLGRGELHLSILIENMRREGFELQVSKPKVIIKEIDGVKCEPYEDLQNNIRLRKTILNTEIRKKHDARK